MLICMNRYIKNIEYILEFYRGEFSSIENRSCKKIVSSMQSGVFETLKDTRGAGVTIWPFLKL